MIYLDNAATTSVCPEALSAMLPYLKEEYGNPSGVYSLSRNAHSALDKARSQTAKAIGAKYPREIFFTSCGTESDNWALFGSAWATNKKHIVISAVEHHAIINAAKQLEKLGYEVSYAMPDKYGVISPQAVEAVMRDDTFLVSVMLANNEVGTINPIGRIAEVAHRHGALMHTDAVQAAGHIPVDVTALGTDMLSISGHKFHAPKGVGALYIRNGVKIESFMSGGSQERGKRAGTENLSSIVGMGKAIETASYELKDESRRIAALRDHLQKRIITENSGIFINGNPENRLPGNLNIAIDGVRSDAFIFTMDTMGICCSSGSACAAGSAEPSHVLMAMGIRPELSKSVIRFSLSRYTTAEEIDKAADALRMTVAKLRRSRR